MEVVPRIKTAVAQIIPELEKEIIAKEPIKTGSEPNHVIVVVIFATLIVMLVVLVVWLISHNKLHWNTPVAKPAHANVVKSAASSELELFANLNAEQPYKPVTALIENHIDDATLEKIPAEVKPALDVDIDEAVKKMDADSKRGIERVHLQSGEVLDTYTSADSVAANYDYVKVLACCRGESANYNNYLWRFVDADQI